MQGRASFWPRALSYERSPYLYFQCSEVDSVKWCISEECYCRGFKLKPEPFLKCELTNLVIESFSREVCSARYGQIANK